MAPLLLDLCQFEVESVCRIEESEPLSRGMFRPVEVAALAACARDLEGGILELGDHSLCDLASP